MLDIFIFSCKTIVNVEVFKLLYLSSFCKKYLPFSLVQKIYRLRDIKLRPNTQKILKQEHSCKIVLFFCFILFNDLLRVYDKRKRRETLEMNYVQERIINQSAGAVAYTDCIFAEGL